jgi:hypothetical protein
MAMRHSFGIADAGYDELNTPAQNTWRANHRVLVIDQANQRVIEVDHDQNIVCGMG